MVNEKDIKKALALLGVVLVFVGFYAFDAFYNKRTGKIETEYIVKTDYVDSVRVQGFAVRDEAVTASGKNISVLEKQEGLVYVPIIADGENVAKGGTIALAFSDEQQAENYRLEQEYREKLAAIKDMQNNSDLSYSNVLYLNKQISSEVSDYIALISGSDLSALSASSASIAENMTSKQIAVGEEIDFDQVIGDYNAKIKELKNSYTVVKKLTAPYAGYFVGMVDGYESLQSYDAVRSKKISVGDGEKMLALQAADPGAVYGKIIAQHTWYYTFDVKLSDASVFRTGYWVEVSFEDLGIHNIDMKVYNITETKDDTVTVTLVCTAMNEDLALVRKEAATVKTAEYTGFKISQKALSENEDGVVGVYAVVGNVMMFSPVEVLFYGDGYVIATGKQAVKNSYIKDDVEKFEYYHILKSYDKIIVKGINLEDGNIVD